MKRIFASLAFLSLALAAGAQNMYDAERLSNNHYYGTARSVALGNAMTALGGDLGSIGINPAGSAVNSFSQFTFTPALLFQDTRTKWSNDGSENLGSPGGDSHTKLNIPNCGLTLTMYSGEDEGLRYMTAGFVVNTTNTFLNYATAGGPSTGYTSFLANLAANAKGIPANKLPGRLYPAYWSDQIGEYGPEGSLKYSGSNQIVDPTDTYAYVPGVLDQEATVERYGSKTDVIFNLGLNFDDKFYLGFNMGLPTARYRNVDAFTESAASPVVFPVNFLDDDGNHIGKENEPTTYYKSSRNEFRFNVDASGIYAKMGIIWLPVEGLRVGAAIQSPTLMVVHESWIYKANCKYRDSDYNTPTKSSEPGDYSYGLRTPYIVNAGLAYTLGYLGLVSVDYEMTDYSIMKFSDSEWLTGSSAEWMDVNASIKKFCGVSHSLRAGLEVKPLPELAVRAGYSFTSSPEKYATDADYGYTVVAENWEAQELKDFRYFRDFTNAFSLGLGYSSRGSFFADAAVRLTKYPTAVLAPYYYPDYQVVDKNNNTIETGMPYFTMDRSIVDVLLTVGWRF